MSELRPQAIYFDDPKLTVEERLARAYDQAAAVIRSTLLPGQQISQEFSQADLISAQSYGENRAEIDAAMDRNVDVPDENGVAMQGNISQAYHVGKFLECSKGLGVYLSGYGRQMVEQGQLSQAEFQSGADARLRAYSSIINLGERGAATSAINPGRYSIERAKANGIDPSNLNGGRIVIATPGVTAGLSYANGTQGLGEPITLTAGAIAAIVGVVIAAVGVLAFVVNWSMDRKRVAETQAKMLDMCQVAIQRQHPDAKLICKDMAAAIQVEQGQGQLEKLIGKSTLETTIKTAAPWILGGLGLYIFIQASPSIVAALRRAKKSARQDDVIARMEAGGLA